MKQLNNTENKVLVVTGASSGIGKAIALKALGLGWKVVLAARNMEAMQLAVTEAGFDSKQWLIVQADVAKKDDCRKITESCIRTFGRMDVLINNAGLSMRALFADVAPEVLERLMQVNFWGTVYCTHYALPWLLQSGGSVVGVSSVAGFKGLPGRTGYSASKFAMHGFLEALRIENLKTGLHVLIACPGFTASNIRKTALGKDGSQQGESPRNEAGMMTAEEVAARILIAVEKRKRKLVLTRQGKMTLLLNTLLPGLTDRLVYRHMASEPDAPFGKT